LIRRAPRGRSARARPSPPAEPRHGLRTRPPGPRPHLRHLAA
jgi:hypothetical protein